MKTGVIEEQGKGTMVVALPCNLCLQQACGADDGVLRDLFVASRPETERALFALPGIGSDLRDMQWQARQTGYAARFPHLVVWLVRADRGDSSRGAIASLTISRDKTHVRLVDIAIHPDARGRGTGTRLMQWLQATAARDALPLCLSVATGSPARRLYERLGFRVVSMTETDLEMVWQSPAPDLRPI